MNRQSIIAILGYELAFALLMSLPWLVPHMGWTVLVGWIPLLILERLTAESKLKHFFWCHYSAFVLWNALTTWWVCNATLPGGICAVLANALQMSVIFGSFRWVKKRLGGALPYFYLAAAWMAWEKFYLSIADISWPWLVLGNAFADTTSMVQWYSVTGHMGGSLWAWTTNLSIFGLMVALSDGRMARWNAKARISAFAGVILALFGPMVWSRCIRFEEEGTPLEVVIGQPNLDPYQKFESLTQEQQDRRLLAQFEKARWPADSTPVLALGPETFTSQLITDDMSSNATVRRFQPFLRQHPGASLLFGASAYDRQVSYSAPNICSYDLGSVDGSKHLWYTSHNSAVIMDAEGPHAIYHKSKLVVGVELTPYPRVFLPLERWLGGSLMGKEVGQKEISCLPMELPQGEKLIGAAVCYESVYGEYCAGYVRKGANLLTVITNDAWWGDTAGYRQHFNYSRLRAIETRRWIARCGNTGISAIIDPRGKVLDRTPWWQEAVLQGQVQLLEGQSFFVRYGDFVGRVSVLLFLLLGAAALFRHRNS